MVVEGSVRPRLDLEVIRTTITAVIKVFLMLFVIFLTWPFIRLWNINKGRRKMIELECKNCIMIWPMSEHNILKKCPECGAPLKKI